MGTNFVENRQWDSWSNHVAMFTRKGLLILVWNLVLHNKILLCLSLVIVVRGVSLGAFIFQQLWKEQAESMMPYLLRCQTELFSNAVLVAIFVAATDNFQEWRKCQKWSRFQREQLARSKTHHKGGPDRTVNVLRMGKLITLRIEDIEVGDIMHLEPGDAPPVHDDDAVHERLLQIPGVLQGIPTSAVPDFGSSFDIISEQFIKDNGLIPDPGGPKITYSLPDGRQRTFLGTITLSWSFAAESSVHHRIFHILHDSVHPLLFGRSFLKTTHTMSKNVNRIMEAFIRTNNDTFTPKHVLFVDHRGADTIGSTERILGLINSHPTLGFADTCSNISIIRRKAAHRLGLTILSGPEHTTEVQLVDGSTSSTTGIVKNVDWRFGFTFWPRLEWHRLDLHVMDGIPCDVILDKWLLWDNDAFNLYSGCFVDVKDNSKPLRETTTGRENPVCLIRRVKKGVVFPTAAATLTPVVDPRDAEAARLAAAADEDVRRQEQAAAAAAAAHLTEGNNNTTTNNNSVSMGSLSPTASTPPAPSSSGSASQSQQPSSQAPSQPLPSVPSPLASPPAGSNNNSGTAHKPYWKRLLKRGRGKP